MREITIRRPDDFHVHFRDGGALEWIPLATASVFARALVMPNTEFPIRTGPQALAYKQRIIEALSLEPSIVFEPLMTIMLTPETTPDTVAKARENGVVAAKLYPRGATTKSAHGVELSKLGDLLEVFNAMEETGMVLCVHGEDPDVPILEREQAFLPVLINLADGFPRLRIVMEHVTTRAAVTTVVSLPDRVAATITAHHLRLTIDDVIGGRMRPHHFCLPVAKTADDRKVLRDAVMSGNPKFFFGSDSAPHPIRNKECEEGAPGIFSAPVALPILAEIFDGSGHLDRLEDFVSRFGAEFYGLPLNNETITLTEKRWSVPSLWGHARTFGCNEPLHWAVAP